MDINSKVEAIEDRILINPNFRHYTMLISYLTSNHKVRNEERSRLIKLCLLKWHPCNAE